MKVTRSKTQIEFSVDELDIIEKASIILHDLFVEMETNLEDCLSGSRGQEIWSQDVETTVDILESIVEAKGSFEAN